jgi:hypothetical protein
LAPRPPPQYAKDRLVAGNHAVPPPLAWTGWKIDELPAELVAGW